MSKKRRLIDVFLVVVVLVSAAAIVTRIIKKNKADEGIVSGTAGNFETTSDGSGDHVPTSSPDDDHDDDDHDDDDHSHNNVSSDNSNHDHDSVRSRSGSNKSIKRSTKSDRTDSLSQSHSHSSDSKHSHWHTHTKHTHWHTHYYDKNKKAPSPSPTPGPTRAPHCDDDTLAPVATAPLQRVRVIDYYLAYVIPRMDGLPSNDDLSRLVIATHEFWDNFFTDFFQGSAIRYVGIELTAENSGFNAGIPVPRFNYYVDFTTTLLYQVDDDTLSRRALFLNEWDSQIPPNPRETFEIMKHNANLISYIVDYVRTIPQPPQNPFIRCNQVIVETQDILAPLPTVAPNIAPVQQPVVVPTAPVVSPTRTPVQQPDQQPIALPTAPVVTSTTAPVQQPVQQPVTVPTTPVVPPTTAPVQQPIQQPAAVPTTPITPITPTVAPVVTPTASPVVPPTEVSNDFTTELDLTAVPGQYRTFFSAAATRWSQAIVGDLSDYTITPTDIGLSRCTNLPAVVDDVYICASVQSIDGVDGVVGQGGPETIRRVGNKFLPVTGYMRFDIADIDELRTDEILGDVIFHEMGHALGFGTMWEINELLGADQCSYKVDTVASAEYQALSGCSGVAVPVEPRGAGAGTECVHWSELCLGDELMTGTSQVFRERPVSRITIAGLEDLGYVVNYRFADTFTVGQLDASCTCSNRQRGLSLAAQSHGGLGGRPELSQSGRNKAVEFGKQHLKAMRENREELGSTYDDVIYLGDKVVSIFYREDGYLHGVRVRADDDKDE